MYMRIVRAQPPQDQADEVARRWTAFWPEKLRTQPGFRHAHFGIDRATGAIAGVTVFDEQPDDALFERLSSVCRASVGRVPGDPRGYCFRSDAKYNGLRDRRRGLRLGQPARRQAGRIAGDPPQPARPARQRQEKPCWQPVLRPSGHGLRQIALRITPKLLLK